MGKNDPLLPEAVYTGPRSVPTAVRNQAGSLSITNAANAFPVSDTFNNGNVAQPNEVENSENRSYLTSHDQAGRNAAFVRDLFSEYYARGINVLKPEIVLTSEFIPIIKDHNGLPGLKVYNGESKVTVNQVFRLIELHRAVQKGMNEASTDFINVTSGFDTVAVYEEAKLHFNDNLYKSSLKEPSFIKCVGSAI